MKLKFRCWNGETMISPDYVDRSGIAWWKENSIPTSSKDVMLYLGWKNKYKQELCEGDVLESDGGVKRTIIYDPNWGWVFDSGTPIYHAYHWKVVGHAYEKRND